MSEDIRLTSRVGYHPHFSWSYLLPKYWGIWFGVFLLLILGLLPFRWRDRLAAKIAKLISKKAKKQYHRANINLQYCFPDWDEAKRHQVIEDMFVTVAQVMLGVGEIVSRSKKHLQQRTEFIGLHYLQQARAEGKNILLLVPHGWAIDASGIMLQMQGFPITYMFNPHKNPLVDWLWTVVRLRFGGALHARQNGIKPFLQDIKRGNVGYYLPDEDYGAELSVFVDFFATYKATLPGINKIAKLSKAVVLPMFPCYDAKQGKYQVEIMPAMELTDDPEQSARAMNEVIEYFVTPKPEQYVWILRLLKTRKDEQDIYR